MLGKLIHHVDEQYHFIEIMAICSWIGLQLIQSFDVFPISVFRGPAALPNDFRTLSRTNDVNF